MSTDNSRPLLQLRSLCLNALLFACLSFVLTLYCLELIKVIGQISPLWFPTALMTVVVFRHPTRDLPYLLSGCVIGLTCANVLFSGFSLSSLVFPLVNLLQALAGGMLLRRLLDRNSPLNSLLSWLKMVVVAGIFISVLGGVMAYWLLQPAANSTLHFLTTWTLSEAIGMLALGPVGLLWQTDYVRRHLRQTILVETLLTLMATLTLCWLTLRYAPSPFTFVVVILFYSAVRLPRFEAFVVYLATISMMSLMLAFQMITRDTSSLQQLIAMPWVPFLLALIPSHMMTLVMHSFREERKHISESESRFRHAMEYSAIGMALVSTGGQWLKVNQSLAKFFGYTPEELYNLTAQQLTHPDDLAAGITQARSLLAGEIETYSQEKRYLREDGEIVWALVAVSLVRDSEQQPLYFIAQIEDISELKQTENINKRLMERITLANEAGGIGVWECDLQSGMISWDKRMFQIYQLPKDSPMTFTTWEERLHPNDREIAIARFDNAIKHAVPVDIEFRIVTDHGVRHIRSQCNTVCDDKGRVERMLGVNQDITSVRLLTDALYQEKERMHITLDAIGEAVISTDEKMRVAFMNPVAEKMSGWLQHQASGKPISDILRLTHGSDGPAAEDLLSCDLAQLKKSAGMDTELVLHNRSGHQFAVNFSHSPLKTLKGESIGSVMVIQDVSEAREMMRRLSYSASHDMLTRLPNRASFEHQLKLLVQSSPEQQQHALVFIDLDRFKAVNDSAGHAAGDRLLREISAVMKKMLRADDVLARLGGDEFGVLMPACPTELAGKIIGSVLDAVNTYPFLWDGREHRIGASAGLTQISADNANINELMAQADRACYHAKHSGRGRLSVY
ncbi:diguanylate cyclase [Erwinia amylovora]|uniref:diguanylate cyclase n=1 Tax=Erwinia amylovora TaxID=552 RepID=UPI0014442569|nr:diguanylate cyclase [Erwinia amylovora]